MRCLRFCIAFEALGKRHFNSTEICTVLNSLIGQSDEQWSTQAFCQGPTAKRLRVEHVSHILTGERWQNMAEILIHFLGLRSRVHASGLLLQLLCLHCLLFLVLWISLVISTSLVPLALGVVHLIRMRLLSYCSIVVCICSFGSYPRLR